MVVITKYSLIPEGHQVPQAWFDTPIQNYRGKSEFLKSILAEQIAALQAFYLYQISPDEAAQAITRPISNSSIPELGTYSDEIAALVRLWKVLVKALIEWPPSRTPDLIALLTAISNIPDYIHRGEAIEEDGRPLAWSGLPYLGMPWRDSHWMEPSDIAEACSNDEVARQHSRDNYLKQQDVEAQLVGAGIFDMKEAFYNLILILEKKLDPIDGNKDNTEPDIFELFQPDFDIPAVVCWIKHDGRKVYEILRENRTEYWNEKYISCIAKHFDQPIERWSFWENRLIKIAKDTPDDFVRNAAELAVRYMRDIKNTSQKL
ncbi:hypothetical protein PHISCL_01913 [Aspergillus sclerotialis]|uniref:Uncharacterized protein n=1 Tax=Aspergillus sclerotialis TaxID=2070753 RepID=A0A3A3A6X2_9EURO|nr:hypothetical protein PHISCL_01913 [Aspergillus sclerotialis]